MRNRMHEHVKCSHELKYCDQCDVVYCELCKTEWKRQWYTMSYNNSYQTLGDGTKILLLNHSHDEGKE